MTRFTIKRLTDIGLIPKKLKQVLVLLGCSTYEDMLNLSHDKIKVDYIERSHHLKDELFKAISDIQDLEVIIPELAESVRQDAPPRKIAESRKQPKRKFKVCDFAEDLLKKTDDPIKQDDLLDKIKKYLPDTYIESVRANLNGDSRNRFVFFLDGYVGLRDKVYDKRYQLWSVEGKKVQYAEQRIMEFLSFMEDKHRSPQPHGLEEEESLYRWYLDFTKSTSKEFAELQKTFKEYLKDYEQWMFTPKEYSYKRNCDQLKWYVDLNMELPTQENEPELATWFNSQLGNYQKHKDKRKKMFEELIVFLSDYGLHFYDAKSEEGKAVQKRNTVKKEIKQEESALEKYIRLFDIISKREDEKYAVHKALLILAIGKLIQEGKIGSIEIILNDDLLTEFADVCIDNVGTASSYNIALPYYYMNEEPFWSLIPKEMVACEEAAVQENLTFDYIERTFSCSIIDSDLYEVLANDEEYRALKKILLVNILNRENGLSDNVPDNLDKQEEDEDINIDEVNIIPSFTCEDFFPLFGITLGKTTWRQVENMGIEVEIWKEGPDRLCHVENITFWDFNGVGIFTSLYICRYIGETVFPPIWVSKGFSWDISYNEWLSVFKKLGFVITVKEKPSIKKWKNRNTLSAKFEALSSDGLLLFMLDFDYGEDGYLVSSPKTLYWIDADYKGEIPVVQTNYDEKQGDEDGDVVDVISGITIEEFFPLFGITLGKTTLKEAEDKGNIIKESSYSSSRFSDIQGVYFWEYKNSGIFDQLYWTHYDADFPSIWKAKGFSWDNSYNEWMEVFRKNGFNITVTKKPTTDEYQGRKTLSAKCKALSSDGLLLFMLDFDYGEDGYLVSSPKTLNTITVNYQGEISEVTNNNLDETEEVYDYDEFDDERVEIEYYTERTGEEIEKVTWPVTDHICGLKKLMIPKNTNDIGTDSFMDTYLCKVERAELFNSEDEIE